MRTSLHGLAFAALAVALAACAPANAPGAASGANAIPGVLRIVNLAEPDTLNPVVGNQQIEIDLASIWGDMLFTWTDANRLVPDLATEVPTLENGGISRDGRTIVYHLRRGVRWQDGAPFDARDVIFSWHAVMNKRNNVPNTTGYDRITTIEERGPYEIAVHLAGPYAPFVATFFAPSANPYPLLPRHLLARYPDINAVPFDSAPVGTGPFSVERWQRGSKIVFRANPHYWRGAPKLREIWYLPVGDDNTILTLLESHQADLEYRAPATRYEQYRAIPGFHTVLSPYTEFGIENFNFATPALADVRVRRALWYALDTNAVLRDVTHGVNTPGYTDQPVFSWVYDAAARHYPYDPAKARALLSAAGWRPGPDGIRTKNGARLTLVLTSSAGSAIESATDVLAQRYWHDAGIDVQIRTFTTSLYFSSYGAGGILQRGKYDVATYAYANGTDPDDSTQWMCDQFPPAGQNSGRYCDPALDAAERVALTSNDPAVRKRAYGDIQRIWADDAPAIILWYARRVIVESDRLHDYRPAHAVTDFWNAYEWDVR